jgi:hypothetical protein
VGGVANRQNPRKWLGQNDSAVRSLKTFLKLASPPTPALLWIFGYKNVDNSSELIHHGPSIINVKYMPLLI